MRAQTKLQLSETNILRNLISHPYFQTQFQSVDVGRHLVDVERLLQAHALQELQLGAIDDSIRRLVRGSAAAGGGEQLQGKLDQLQDSYNR